jgi:peptidoglycan/LPS O-acetylase OafA/YrhL
MNISRYRADIDGLRAIAVLCVLFFHTGLPFFGGGFVGVDIFFVISGFLITRLIRDEFVEKGSFDFKNFYVRRGRRLFPGLFFTMLLCTAFSIWLFSPQHLARFGGELIHALLSLSNVFFWRESGYFDPAADYKPLLHTWSLSIEEQFYLIWPLFLVFILKRTLKWITPFLIFIISPDYHFLVQLFLIITS